MKCTNLKWKTTEEYAVDLIKHKKVVDPITFLKTACTLQKEIIDSHAIFIFHKLYDSDQLFTFSIHHTDLLDMRVLTSPNTFEPFIKKLDLIEKKDYIQLGDLYMLTPSAFKYCLFTSKHGKKYIIHFSILENMMQEYYKCMQVIHQEMTWNDVTVKKIIDEYHKQDISKHKKVHQDIQDIYATLCAVHEKTDILLTLLSPPSSEEQDEYDIV